MRMNRKILAIEDDKDALSNLQDILELDGYRVIGASTLKEAIDRRPWTEYSVILLDRQLPDGTPYPSLAMACRADGRSAGTGQHGRDRRPGTRPTVPLGSGA